MDASRAASQKPLPRHAANGVSEHMEKKVSKAAEGLRERKRRQTRERIAQAAMTLFLDQGFEATTIDQIAEAISFCTRAASSAVCSSAAGATPGGGGTSYLE